MNCFNDQEHLTKYLVKDWKNTVFVDTETTGLKTSGPDHDEITEYACVHWDDSVQKWVGDIIYFKPQHHAYLDVRNTFSQPKGDIDPSAMLALIDKAYLTENSDKPIEIKMVTQDFVKRVWHLSYATGAKLIASLMQNKIVVEHNGLNFDEKLLNLMWTETGIAQPNYLVVDTCLLATYRFQTMKIFSRAFSPKTIIDEPIKNVRQTTLGEYYDTKNIAYHDALGDTWQLKTIYEKLLDDFEKLTNSVFNDKTTFADFQRIVDQKAVYNNPFMAYGKQIQQAEQTGNYDALPTDLREKIKKINKNTWQH